jgi:hypothetical protein
MNIRRALKRIFYVAVVTALLLIAIGPWGLYWLGLYGINGKPSLPSVAATKTESEKIWSEARGKGEIKVNSITPHGYIYLFFSDSRNHPGLRVSWRVAANHNLKYRKYKGNGWWHLSGAALTIWLSHNWSTDRIISKVAEIERSDNG